MKVKENWHNSAPKGVGNAGNWQLYSWKNSVITFCFSCWKPTCISSHQLLFDCAEFAKGVFTLLIAEEEVHKVERLYKLRCARPGRCFRVPRRSCLPKWVLHRQPSRWCPRLSEHHTLVPCHLRRRNWQNLHLAAPQAHFQRATCCFCLNLILNLISCSGFSSTKSAVQACV